MRIASWISTALIGMLAFGCSEPTAPPPEAGTPGVEPLAAKFAIGNLVIGAGRFVNPTLGSVNFAYTALRLGNGQVMGKFFQDQRDLGFIYAGDVTCFAVDPVNHRAWIGGVLTYSNDPDPITEVGDDAWFRVLDTGKGGQDPDRSTFLGFEGGGGIITSDEYCAAKIWPDDNARTWPVEKGSIVIR